MIKKMKSNTQKKFLQFPSNCLFKQKIIIHFFKSLLSHSIRKFNVFKINIRLNISSNVIIAAHD